MKANETDCLRKFGKTILMPNIHRVEIATMRPKRSEIAIRAIVASYEPAKLAPMVTRDSAHILAIFAGIITAEIVMRLTEGLNNERSPYIVGLGALTGAELATAIYSAVGYWNLNTQLLATRGENLGPIQLDWILRSLVFDNWLVTLAIFVAFTFVTFSARMRTQETYVNSKRKHDTN